MSRQTHWKTEANVVGVGGDGDGWTTATIVGLPEPAEMQLLRLSMTADTFTTIFYLRVHFNDNPAASEIYNDLYSQQYITERADCVPRFGEGDFFKYAIKGRRTYNRVRPVSICTCIMTRNLIKPPFGIEGRRARDLVTAGNRRRGTGRVRLQQRVRERAKHDRRRGTPGDE